MLFEDAYKGQKDEEVNVGSHWMTLRKREDNGP